MARFRTLSCPNCAAPLEVPETHERYFRCGACEAALEDTAYEEPTPEVVLQFADPVFDVGDLLAYHAQQAELAAQRQASSGCISALLVAALLAAGAIAAAVWFFSEGDELLDSVAESSSGTFDITSFSSGRFVASDDGSEPDLIVVGRSSGGQRVMYIDFDAEPPTRWTIESADAAVSVNDAVVASGDLVYVVAERAVYAFDRRTGQPHYTLGLPDVVAPICVDCVQLFDGAEPMLVVLTSDGSLNAFVAETGAPRWTQRLPSDLSRRVINVGGHPTVAVGTDGTDGAVVGYHVDDGTPVSTQHPSCEAGGRLVAVDPVFPLGDDGVVWVGSSAGSACAQAWRTGSSEPLWTATLDTDGAFPETSEALIASESLLVPGRGGAWIVDLATGDATDVQRTESGDVLPVGVLNGVAVFAEVSNRGSDDWSLIGVSSSDAALLWTLPLSGDPLDPSLLAIPRQVGWVVDVNGGNLSVINIDDESATLDIRSVDPQTGVASSGKTIEIDGGLLGLEGYYPSGSDGAAIAANKTVRLIDLTTATSVATAP